MFEIIVDLMQKYGMGIVVFAYFLYLFNKQNKTLEADRDNLLARIVVLEDEEKKNHEFIKLELSSIIKAQTEVLLQVNATMLQQTKEYSKLCETVGKLGNLRL